MLARRERIQDAVLLGLVATAAVGMIALAPGAGQLLRFVDPSRLLKKETTTRHLNRALYRLRDHGLVRIEKARGKRRNIELTARGRALAERLRHAERIRIQKPKRWDGRWRVVIFDVWERRRSVRDRLRRLLVATGFVKLQDSVWVYPYDCEELITFVKHDLRLGSGMLYLIAEGIEGDRRLRQHFKLPN